MTGGRASVIREGERSRPPARPVGGMTVRILVGDCREALASLADESVHCVVTSPPYWGLRSYNGESGMIGMEPTFDEHLSNLVDVFREVRRVLRGDGTLWLNYGDAYAGGGRGQGGIDPNCKQATNAGTKIGNIGGWQDTWKPKDLMLMPARVAMALQADGWWLRSEIVWHKPNPMPESVTDRPTSAHEKLFLLSKSARYFYDADAVSTPSEGWNGKDSEPIEGIAAIPRHRAGGGFDVQTANLRNVWRIATQSYREAHFATFPPALVEPCIKAGCPADGVVLDPFGGAGTVGLVADRLRRDAVLVEISPEYGRMAQRRIESDAGLFAGVTLHD